MLLRCRASIATSTLILAACTRQGDKREFLGPPETKPTDGAITKVIVTPGLATAHRGEAIRFAASAVRSTGENTAVDVTWSATGGSVSGSGIFSATEPGTYWVVARSTLQADKADSASVAVVGAEELVSALTLSPRDLVVRVGQTRQFTALARTASGATSTTVPLFWTTSGGAIDQTGRFSAVRPGAFLVIAVAASGVADTARVTVNDNPVLLSLKVEPDSVELAPGGTEQFGVRATWSDGSTAVPEVDFGTDGGTIDATGHFVAGGPVGDFQVTAVSRSADIVSVARVRIRRPRMVGLTVTPTSTRLSPGGVQRFVATGSLSDGQVILVTPQWVATGGSIDTDGNFSAGSVAGSYRVTATYNGFSTASPVTISVPAATLIRLTLNPSSVRLAVGQGQPFFVTGSWSDGSSTTPPVIYSATGGVISVAGQYKAGTVPGGYRVIAKHDGGTAADTSDVTIVAPEVSGVTLTPATASVETSKSIQFAATVTWTDGSTGPAPLTWTAAGGSISGSGLFMAGSAAGTFAVVARAASGAADTSFVTVTTPPPVLQSLTVTPGAVSVQTAQQQQFVVSGVWSNGGSGAPSVTWTATGGTITSGGLFKAGSSAGNYRVIAKQQGGTLADTSSVTVLPPAPVLTAIVLSPGAATVQAGATQQFATTGVWTNGGSGNPAVTYSATGGTISSSGLFTAGGTPGIYSVIAVQLGGTLADTSAVTVTAAPPQLIGIELTPASASVTTGKTQQFDVAGLWTNGGTGAPAVTWSATGGTISAAGLYTAGVTPGTYRVIATQQGATLADTAAVTVAAAPPSLASLTIQPKTLTIQAGLMQQFSAAALWSDGSTNLPAVTWSATGGTISSNGLYSAPSVGGTYQVIVAGGSKADTSAVTVTVPVVTSLTLTPGTANVTTGSTQQFQAVPVWSDGVNRPAAVAYSATGGAISTAGVYSATTPGDFRVMAAISSGAPADTSTIDVVAPAPVLTQLVLNPSSASLPTGGTQQFSVSGVWSDGSSTAPAVTYSATGGTISAAGLFAAGTAAGTYRVIATQQGGTLADTSVVTLTAPFLVSLTVSPDPASVLAGASQQFSVGALWSNGGTTLPSLSWTATGGTISGSGLFVAGSSPGTYRAIVSGGGKADTAVINVAAPPPPVLTQLVLNPSSAALATGSTQQFTISGVWSDGSSTAPAATFSATGGTISAAGLYTAGTIAGTYRVIATQQGGTLADTSVVTLTAPTLVSLTVSPDPAAVMAGGSRQFSASALWSNGGTTVPSLAWTATGGSINTAGLYVAGSSTGTFRAIATGGGKADTAVINVSAPGANNLYFNSAEVGCGTDPNLLLCDDFEDGDWYIKNCDQANSSGGLLQTDGWCGTIYSTISPAGAAVCGGTGFRSNCAATSGFHDGSIGGNLMADHGFAGGGGLNEASWRLYFQPQADYVGGHEKMFDFTRGVGTGQMVSLCYNYFGARAIQCIPYLHQDDGLSGASPAWMGSNVGSEVTLQPGHWYFIEMHVRLNTPGSYDGLFEMWLNDCGANGLGCTGTPTLRARYTNVKYRNAGAEASVTLGGIWIENWANPGTRGTMYYDQVKAAKTGPIGFMP